MEAKTIEDIKKALPTRFKRGEGLAGPEYYGCFNTGSRPIIKRMPYKEFEKPIYLVGPELEIDSWQHTIAVQRLYGSKKRFFGENNRKVFVFQGRSSAVAKFLELCDQVMNWNAEQHEKHCDLKDRAKKGDVAAVLELGDF